MFRYCPSCASQNIRFEREKVFRCPDCGFTYYHNIAAATGCMIQTGGKVLFLVRGKEPLKGRLDLPGGFVDKGEGALEGLRRELQEEIGWEPPGDAKLELFASFPNVYPYKGIVYQTCDLFFTVEAPSLKEDDFRLEAAEIEGLRFADPKEIKSEEFAFDSTRRAVEAFLKRRS
ncbi:MAG: NUDIX domain-containing protein [Treponema sp.]|jgi:ADP-ribose pyrophosphatase YjhB (NUDIX family)|nr:NUDIX domain-containing protein [Treponema sp.]